MLIGLVKWFDLEKGFGVIGTPDAEEYFLHINSFLKKPENLPKGTAIIFSKKTDKNKNRNSAENSRLVGQIEDWKTIFNYLGKPDNVRIEVEIRGRGMRGNSYHQKEVQSFSLIKSSVKQYLKGKSETELTNVITGYYVNDLDRVHFISYCEHIEYRIKKDFLSETSLSILNNVFSYFRENLNDQILFEVWKQKKFKFISYTDKDDYEIPESILTSNISEINIPELRRILNFSYGSVFCTKYVNIKFNDIDNLSSSKIKELYNFLEFENENEREKRKSHIDNLYAQQIKTELIEQAKKFELIKNNDDFNNYNRLFQLIPTQFNDEIKNKIKEALNKLIDLKCSDEFKPELWIKGIIEDTPFELVSKYFHEKDTQSEKRINILSKLQPEKQFELLNIYSVENGVEKAFALIEGLVKKVNSLSYYFNISEVLYNTEFWQDKKCKELIHLFVNYVQTETGDEQKYELFFKGYVKDVPLEKVYQNINNLKRDDCRRIFKSIPENISFIKNVLEEKISTENFSDLNWLYDLANEFLDIEGFNSFDIKVYEKFEKSEYFKLWKNGKAKIFPDTQIGEILNDKFENYAQIETWIKNKATTSVVICDFLFSYLSRQDPVTDRRVFYKHLNHIKYLLGLDALYLEKLKLLQIDLYNVILWYLDKEEILDFELLKQKFIYFAPKEQIRIIRKLFFLKAGSQFDLTIEKLNELTRFDLDLYKTNLYFNPEIPVDISTDVVIKALLSYKETQRFFVESELLTIILDDLNLDKTMRFRLSDYFENCLGRQIAEFNWSRNGEISKVKYGDNKFYFAITFEYDPNLVEAVKSLPGRKWNNEEKVWGVPSQYEKEVLEFANNNRFFLDFEGSNYANNTHLADFKREDKPNGISFCEGRSANRPHEMFKKDFWWCAGQPCFSKCETIHQKEEWEKYTLLDFCEILGFNTDETNRMGDHIPKGRYYQFVALINRFNRLLDKLYCLQCNHILCPSDFGTSHFAAHTVVRFQCRNDSCSHNDEIYLNHCLNGQCNCIIDSRVSKRCDNGLFICDNCGSCCSHEMLKRRLANLELTGGYIHENLRNCVNEKLGHLERGEYFCHKCKSEMTEVGNDVFECTNCNVKYDTTKYKFKRPHIHLKQKRTPNGNNTDNDNSEEFDFPF